MKQTNTTERLKKALASFDRAVQAWYKEHDPDNKERYATVHIRTYPCSKAHMSNATLRYADGKFIDDIASALENREGL